LNKPEYRQFGEQVVDAGNRGFGAIETVPNHHRKPRGPPPLSPAPGPPTEWAEVIHAHDDRNVFQASPDELPVINVRSL